MNAEFQDIIIRKSVTCRNIIVSKSNGYSMIPVVGALARRTSCSVGRYEEDASRSRSLK